jgi:predicted PurR-regulated permease PerM
MTELGAPHAESDDRRHRERRIDPRVLDLTLPELRRVIVTAGLGILVLALFLWMVRAVLVAGLLGAIAAAYLRPLYGWLAARTRPVVAGLLTVLALLVPAAAALLYGYGEVMTVAGYVAAHQTEVMTRVSDALDRLRLGETLNADAARGWVITASAAGARLPAAARAAIVRGAVSLTVFAFTVMYLLTDGGRVGAGLRDRVSARYAPLATAFVVNVRGALAGALYGTLLAQVLKAVVIYALALIFRVPLGATLALFSFIIGFFPIVGSWSVYLPMAAWLYVFRDAPLQAVLVVLIGFIVNTAFISTFLRPKMAARRSHVLNFYWMFIGIVTGVYAFGLPGVVLGPAVIGVLKALIDTVTAPSSWPMPPELAEDA